MASKIVTILCDFYLNVDQNKQRLATSAQMRLNSKNPIAFLSLSMSIHTTIQ